jgi:hypothetical protein
MIYGIKLLSSSAEDLALANDGIAANSKSNPWLFSEWIADFSTVWNVSRMLHFTLRSLSLNLLERSSPYYL